MVRSRSHRLLGLVLASGLTLAACASQDSSLEIGFRRIALDLAFRDPEKAVPVEPQVIIRRLVDTEFVVPPAPPGPLVIRRVIPSVETFTCDVAPEGAVPQQPAFPVVKAEPTVGVYPRHNEGTITLELATSSTEIPVPARSKWDVSGVRFVPANKLVADQDTDQVPGVDAARDDRTVFPEIPEFQLTRRLTRGFETTDTYRYTFDDQTEGDFLYLVRRVTMANGVESVFEPSPPIRIMRLNVPEGNLADSGVTHAGLDRDTNVAMTSVSQILGRESVDVCGEVVDTYVVEIKQQFVDLSGSVPETSGNEGDAVDLWNIQIDNGLLIVRERVNRTLRTSTEVLGQSVPITIRYAYTSTLDTLVPDPLPDADEGAS